VALIVDAGALYAQADIDEPRHEEVKSILLGEIGPLITTELVIAEADYLIRERLGVEVEIAFLEDLASGTFGVECLTRVEIGKAQDVVRKHRDLRVGLADASLVALAQRYNSNRLLTFDERAFRKIQPLQGGSFVILPADAK
jgi:uncharacterized protein